MKENYTDKTDGLITELKKHDFLFNGFIVECIKEFPSISRSEIRTAFVYAGLKPSKDDLKYIYEQVKI